jgi:hypothetical protein
MRNQIDDNAELWAQVSVLKLGKANMQWMDGCIKCKSLQTQVHGGTTRIRQHLLGMIGEVAGGGLVLRQRRSVTDVEVRHNINVARSPECKAMIRKLAATGTAYSPPCLETLRILNSWCNAPDCV